MINWEDFQKMDLRIGTIVSAEILQEAIKPAYVLKIDFGELGLKKSSAQITQRYKAEDLIGKQIVAVVNFPPKQIAQIMSECLVLGGMNEQGVSLISTDHKLPNGSKVG